MHLVLINQYYPPDLAPTGWMLEAVAEELVRAGHRVTVLCAAGEAYAGQDAGAEGRRSKVESRKSKVEGRRSKVEGRKSKVESRKSKVEGRNPEKHPESNAALSSGAAVADGRGGGEADVGPADRGAAAPRVLRIGATGFGRNTSVGKLMDYLSFYLGVAGRLACLQPRPDRVVALTTPPYLSVLARGLSKLRGADHAHWVMDLYPDVMVAHGMLRRAGFAHRMLAALGRWGFGGNRRAALLTLGPDMAQRVRELAGDRGPSAPGEPVAWVPLWASTEAGAAVGPAGAAGEAEASALELRRRRGWADDEVVVMYSGNMGLGHRFQEMLAAARVLADPARCRMVGCPRYRFVFHGRGKRRGEIEAFVQANPGLRVELHDYAPAEELAAHLRSADVHLASLEGSWTGTMLPSKTQGVFAAGRPLLVVGEADSSMARWVAESGGGWVVRPGDDPAMLEALGEAADRGERSRRGGAAREYSRRHFSRRENASRCAVVLSKPRESAGPRGAADPGALMMPSPMP
jgi:colanic acid biosynthesis glycosyl transferase WcaI